MPKIEMLRAIEILDSRGRPTVKATCSLNGGASASASVPSGASTGEAEAHELRDGDASRYGGLGCRKAVANINATIADRLKGHHFVDQHALDSALLKLDGSKNKNNLGANTLLAVSIAFARAHAVERKVPPYQHFADMIGQPLRTLPRPTVNLFSGGKHAGGQVVIQDVLVVPMSATTVDESLATVYSVYQSAIELTSKKYDVRALTADEGGLAPPFESIESMFDDAVGAIEHAGFEPGADVALAIDVASSHFFDNQQYHLGERSITSDEMVDTIKAWVTRWPIVSVEDGLAENDWDAWPTLCDALDGARTAPPILTIGDDLLCTNPQRIQRAIDHRAANALLLKVNQIGTLTEAGQSLSLARQADWQVTVSARSGETEDNWLADLAVGWAGNQIKIGSITQSERLAKYNRLLEIEAETGLPLADW